MVIMVTGGAGYIGSHVAKYLLNLGYDVLVLDNLSTGHKQAVDQKAVFKVGNTGDESTLEQIFSQYPITSVMHFAASCYVEESVTEPLKYYQNNVSATVSLLKKMLQYKVYKLVFSSTCAVYGAPEVERIDEETQTQPVNPYGRTKLMAEQAIKDLSSAYGLEFIILRYFNVAGADPSGKLGEYHYPETHLIPNILRHLMGLEKKLIVYGNDYDTKDGTCIRDFIHVCDLAEAHTIALKSLEHSKISNEIYNIGNETGYSINEIIKICEKITNKKAAVIYKAKRKGDPAKLVASSKKFFHDFGWKPRYSIEKIIKTAWTWHSRIPDGFN